MAANAFSSSGFNVLVGARRWIFAIGMTIGGILLAPILWLVEVLQKSPLFFADWRKNPPQPPGIITGPILSAKSDFTDILGTFTGVILSASVPDSEVAPKLPPGVKDPDGGSGYHMVTICFGYQENIHPRGLSFLPGSYYLELVAGVPFLLAKDGSQYDGAIAVLGRLFLNRLLPTILGIVIGLPKRLTRIVTQASSFEIHSLFGGDFKASGRFETMGPVMCALDDPAFIPVAKTFSQPVVSHSILGRNIFTGFHWKWEGAAIQKLNGELLLAPGFAGGKYYLTGINSHITGAWKVRVPWTMRGPYPTKELSDFTGYEFDTDRLLNERSTRASGTAV